MMQIVEDRKEELVVAVATGLPEEKDMEEKGLMLQVAAAVAGEEATEEEVEVPEGDAARARPSAHEINMTTGKEEILSVREDNI